MTNPADRVEIITSVQRRRRWTASEKVRMVEETFEPGMTVSLVARRHGVAPISRLGSLENSIYILGRVAKLIVPIDTVGYQAAECDGLGKRMDIGHPIPMRQGDDQ